MNLLAELDTLLRGRHMRYWLRGGWALDFLLGRETRPHADLDLVVWHRHAANLRSLLETAGYTFRYRGFVAQMDFVKGGAQVSIVLLQRQRSGDLTPYRVPQWVWLPGLLGQARTLHGLTCHTLSAEQLIRIPSDSRTSGKAPDARPSPGIRRFSHSLRSDFILSSTGFNRSLYDP